MFGSDPRIHHLEIAWPLGQTRKRGSILFIIAHGAVMSSTAAWILILIAVAAAAVIGYYTGRHTAPGKRQADALQKELDEQRQAMQQYRESVNRHFEKSATLFTSMAGSYRDLYDHLRESYGELTDSPGRPLLPERAGALLEGERAGNTRQEPTSSTRKPVEAPAQPEPSAAPPAADAESEDMLGDSPHIPEQVDLEEPPETPVKASRDDGAEPPAEGEGGTPPGRATKGNGQPDEAESPSGDRRESADAGDRPDTRRT
jgi:uncharacterized protein